MLTRSHARSIGWAVILAVCFALTVALTFRVNAVRSQVRLTERHIARLQAEKGLLETEFETLSNQQQLSALNDVEFGYQAPTAGQYLGSERQLAAYAKPRGPGAPEMIRVASADPAPASAASAASAIAAMVNPLTGKGAEAPPAKPAAKAADKPATRLAQVADAAKLSERLSRVERLAHVEQSPRLIARVPVEPKKLAMKAIAAKTVASKAAATKAPASTAKPSGPARLQAATAASKAAAPKAASAKTASAKAASAKAASAKAGPAKPAARPAPAKLAARIVDKAPGRIRSGRAERVAIE